MTKLCSTCKATKPLQEFYKQNGGRYRSACKSCYSEHNKQQRNRHHEKRSAYDKGRGHGWDRSGREKYQPTEPQKHDGYLERVYGITLGQYEEMLKNQDGKCAICKGECNRSTTNRLCVDHDHKTGQVRGLLCFKCNTGLGRFGDDTESLQMAIDYLKAAQGKKRPGVFVCGPMTGYKNFNYPAFNKMAKRLRAAGHRVENPAENPVPSCGTWAGYMRLSIQQLVTCDAIQLLPGWQASKGATLEHHIAERLGLAIFTTEDLVPA